jgi:NADH dehydrogenase FAD-containing subunit
MKSRSSATVTWVWVGVGHLQPKKTIFKLKPVYDRKHVKFVHAAAKEIHPNARDQYVLGEEIGSGKQVRLDYDYLVIAPGPLLNFAGLDWVPKRASLIPFVRSPTPSRPAMPTRP